LSGESRMMRFIRYISLYIICCGIIRAGEVPSPDAGWRENFSSDKQFNADWRPEGMHFLVPHTKFYVAEIPSANDGKALVIEAARAAGARVIAPRNVDWQKTPVMRWRWRLVRPVVLKKGKKEPDDQAGAIYVGDGSLASSRCVTYRWEKKSPIGSARRTKYAAGCMNTYVVCAANDSVPLNEWRVEEYDVVKNFIAAFGTPPDRKFMLCVAGNSQYSRSNTRLEIDFIEFIPRRKEAAK
jgi:hypothetical protein